MRKIKIDDLGLSKLQKRACLCPELFLLCYERREEGPEMFQEMVRVVPAVKPDW